MRLALFSGIYYWAVWALYKISVSYAAIYYPARVLDWSGLFNALCLRR
jgi:hypothetical protein